MPDNSVISFLAAVDTSSDKMRETIDIKNKPINKGSIGDDTIFLPLEKEYINIIVRIIIVKFVRLNPANLYVSKGIRIIIAYKKTDSLILKISYNLV